MSKAIKKEFVPDSSYVCTSEESNYPYPVAILKNGGNVKVNEKIARYFIMHQTCINLAGTVRYFQIKNLGLGVYHVKLRDRDFKETVLVKEFEN